MVLSGFQSPISQISRIQREKFFPHVVDVSTTFIHAMQTGCSVAIPRISHTSGCLPFTTNSRKFRLGMVNVIVVRHSGKFPGQTQSDLLKR